VRWVAQREIQVLRETVRFKVAFFEARPSLENPRSVKRRVLVDTGQQPAQNVIFLDDVGLQAGLRCVRSANCTGTDHHGWDSQSWRWRGRQFRNPAAIAFDPIYNGDGPRDWCRRITLGAIRNVGA